MTSKKKQEIEPRIEGDGEKSYSPYIPRFFAI